MAYAFRTRFKKEIVAEFLPPATRQTAGKSTSRSSAKKPKAKQPTRVVIFCSGMPGMPSKKGALLELFSKKGYWAFDFRYRGSWESDGVFLRKSPEQDVYDIIDSLPRGFVSFEDNKRYRVEPDEIYIVATSFGGPAGILASRDPRVKKVVCISPVVDWLAPSKEEPLGWLEGFVRKAFGNGYRFSPREWKKLSDGKFYNPVYHVAEIDGSKLFIFHAKDDGSVGAREVIEFAEATGATLKLFKTGGHLSGSKIVPKYWPAIAKFLKKS